MSPDLGAGTVEGRSGLGPFGVPAFDAKSKDPGRRDKDVLTQEGGKPHLTSLAPQVL